MGRHPRVVPFTDADASEDGTLDGRHQALLRIHSLQYTFHKLPTTYSTLVLYVDHAEVTKVVFSVM